MSYFVGTLAYGSTGTKTAIPVGFTPVGVRVWVSQKFNTSQTFAHQSTGMSDGIDQFYTTIYQDGSGGLTLQGDNKILSHWDRVSGTLTEVLNWELNSLSASGVSFNVVTTNSNYTVILEAWD